MGTCPLQCCLLLGMICVPGVVYCDNDKASVLERICSATGSHFALSQYIPSEWEQEWMKNAEHWGKDICKELTSEVQVPLINHWIQHIQDFVVGNNNQLANFTIIDSLDPKVFSRFEYHDVCNANGGEVVTVYIEPVVGLLRHPLALCFKADVHVEDRNYILVNALPPNAFSILYPGNKYILDLGTFNYDTSLRWFVNMYHKVGVTFDGIFAWEIKTLNDTEYFKRVPKHLLPRLRLYNFPIQKDIHASGHPFALLRQIYQPGDFVVVKLDIDNEPLEQHLIDTILQDHELKHMISEMYFEMHHNAKEMKANFKTAETPYATAMEKIQNMRRAGLRTHCWP